jgi:2-haloacid dehalogenase
MNRAGRIDGLLNVRRREFLQTASVVVVGALHARSGSGAEARQAVPERVRGVRALTFDVFGTVVDWRSSIISEMEALAERKGIDGDWTAFADQWRAGYGPAMGRVRRGELPWTKIDALHRMILDTLVPEFGLQSLTGAELDDLNKVWHRLKPWPDSVAGLTRLKARYVLASLSNGNVALLVNMAKNAGLPWDAVLSAELAASYKPDREVYLKAADLLGWEPEQMMMVAAHSGDLRASAEVGFRTAYVPRPLEYGPDRNRDLTPDPDFDLVATDFEDLAEQLGL